MTPATARRTAPWLLLALAIAAAARLGCRPVDVLLGAIPALCIPALRTLPPDQRRALLRRRLPALIALTMLAALALGWSNASALAAPMPWASAIRFGGYLLLWILALHGLRFVSDHLLRPVLANAKLRGCVVALATFTIGFPNLYVALQTHRIAIAGAPVAQSVAGTAIAFATGDGIELDGTLFLQPNGDSNTPLVIVCHGLGADREAFAGYTALALRLGAHALTFDFRAHGRSGGMVSTLGADEVADLAAAVAWWRSQPGRAQNPIVLLGVSMGGAVVLQAAGMVGAAGVFAESSYAELSAMIEAQTAMLGPLSASAAAAVQMAARWQLGIDPARVSPLRSLRELSPAIPVVLVHAGSDQVISLREGERLAGARADLRLHVSQGAEHAGCLAVDPIGIEQQLRTLLTTIAARR
ncbi:MAG: alpha/beta hydrolase [Planctomycetes bacterium]|jgi:alpha-beta hydrolase superfamily lysophospholipase|nr:alpha/beta hydrolase [Planctomycetota bacterium]